jgi:hypothetical protein
METDEVVCRTSALRHEVELGTRQRLHAGLPRTLGATTHVSAWAECQRPGILSKAPPVQTPRALSDGAAAVVGGASAAGAGRPTNPARAGSDESVLDRLLTAAMAAAAEGSEDCELGGDELREGQVGQRTRRPGGGGR